MKISITETYIEADAKELRESNTLAQNFALLLSRCLQPKYDYGDCEDTEEQKTAEDAE